jgi:hypothetical protein
MLGGTHDHNADFDNSVLHERVIIIIIISGVRLSPLGTAATSGLLYKPQMIDEGDCEAIGGMKMSASWFKQ